MTEAQKNRRVAEWLGWTVKRNKWDMWRVYSPSGKLHGHNCVKQELAERDFPRYTTDLNACAEFEAKIMETPWNPKVWADDKDNYRCSLRVIIARDLGRPLLGEWEIPLLFATATAGQRVDALIAVIGEQGS